MKSTVEHLNPTRVKLTVEVPFDELKPHFDRAYKTLGGQVRIPGFRPGKVPARVLDARLGRGAVLTEVVNAAIPVKYGEAVGEANLTVLGQPDIEVTKIEDGQELAFTAEVDVRPDITLPDVATIAVTVPTVEISEGDVDEQVQALRERFASVSTVERAAVDGDQVTIDLRAEVDGDEVPDAEASELTYRIGSGDLVEGLDDALAGMSAGESKTFTTRLVAGEHAGQDADVTVTVGAVSERALPEVDDEFAEMASQFDTVAEMRDDLKERVRRVRGMSQGADARDKVLQAMLDATEIPTPEGIVQAEYDARVHDAVHSFNHDEAALEAYVAEQGQTREEFEAELRTGAEQAVRTQLLLDALAEAAEIEVTQEEFTERLLMGAQRFGLSPDEYFSRLQKANQLGSIFADVRRGKALAEAVTKATVTDEAGNALDIAKLFGVEDVTSEEATDEETSDEGVTVEGATGEDDTGEGDTDEGDTGEGDTGEGDTDDEDTDEEDADERITNDATTVAADATARPTIAD